MNKPKQIPCWKCGALYEFSTSRLPFSAECEKCASWLHVCKNCKNYSPGLPNDCKISDTEPISDRERRNFCDFFDWSTSSPEQSSSASEAAKKLFGDQAGEEFDREKRKKQFDKLFGDE